MPVLQPLSTHHFSWHLVVLYKTCADTQFWSRWMCTGTGIGSYRSHYQYRLCIWNSLMKARMLQQAGDLPWQLIGQCHDSALLVFKRLEVTEDQMWLVRPSYMKVGDCMALKGPSVFATIPIKSFCGFMTIPSAHLQKMTTSSPLNNNFHL